MPTHAAPSIYGISASVVRVHRLVSSIHKSVTKFPDAASAVVPILMDFLGDANQAPHHSGQRPLKHRLKRDQRLILKLNLIFKDLDPDPSACLKTAHSR